MNERPTQAPLSAPTTFWMVYLANGSGPSFRHLTKEVAQAEAKRLALLHNRAAYVLEATEKIEAVQSVTVTPLMGPLPDEAYSRHI